MPDNEEFSIRQSRRKTICDMHYRLEEYWCRIGTALMASIVKKHNIDINIEGKVGKGTVATLTFKGN